MKEWKMYQELYGRMVTEHSDDKAIQDCRTDPEIIENALAYVQRRDDYSVYPAKSYIVGIIYARLLVEHYGEDFYEVLDDPDLFCGQDSFFVPYSKNPTAYNAILERLKDIPNWMEGGWAPYTAEYFRLECTKEGFESINKPQE